MLCRAEALEEWLVLWDQLNPCAAVGNPFRAVGRALERYHCGEDPFRPRQKHRWRPVVSRAHVFRNLRDGLQHFHRVVATNVDLGVTVRA